MPDRILYPKPASVLPDPTELDCVVSVDTETTGLFPDDGATVAVVSVAFCRKETPDLIEGYAFPFDQGRAADKGFEPWEYVKGGLRANRDLDKIFEWMDGDPIPPGFINLRGHLEVDLELWQCEFGSEFDHNLSQSDWVWLLTWLAKAGEQVGLVGQNIKFDLGHVKNGTRHWSGIDLEEYVCWDTMLTSKRIWPNESNSLKPTGARLYGEDEVAEAGLLKLGLIVNKKLWHLLADDGPRYDLLPFAINVPYASQDAVLTLRLAKTQVQMILDGECPDIRWDHIERDIDLMRVLHRIEQRALGPLDVARTERIAEAIEARIAELEEMLRDDQLGPGIDPVTAPQARKYFFDQLGLRPWKGAEEPRQFVWTTDAKGKPKQKILKEGTLNLDVLHRMADQNVPYAGPFAELVRLKTANQMNYRGYLKLRGPDDRLRTNYRQAHVVTGRMSVERFQAQNIPRRDSVVLAPLPGHEHRGPLPHPRDLFLVEPGLKRITMDLAQAELRVAAQFSNCKLMIEQVLEGRDLHGEMTTQVFALDPDHPDFKATRYIAKRCVFGSIFGIGPKTFREDVWKNAGLEISYKTAAMTVDGFRQLYPEIPAKLEECQYFAEDNGYIDLVDGSRSWFHPDRPWECRTAWSRKVQGSLAIFNADWLISTECLTQDLNHGRGAMVLTVHDSISLEVEDHLVDSIKADCSDWVEVNFAKTFGIEGRVDWENW